jgi:hypothetical protein
LGSLDEPLVHFEEGQREEDEAENRKVGDIAQQVITYYSEAE